MSNILVACTTVLMLSIAAIDTRLAKFVIGLCKNSCVRNDNCYPYYHPDLENIYAIEDGLCKVFISDCIFAAYNCDRVNSCLPELEPVTLIECQQHCRNCENEARDVVCAIFTPDNFTYVGHEDDGRSGGIGAYVAPKAQYRNRCEADRAACKRGIPYAFIEEGYCVYTANVLTAANK